MPLLRHQRNEVFREIEYKGLDPSDFEWVEPYSGKAVVDILRFRPISGAAARFSYAPGMDWGLWFGPGPDSPRDFVSGLSWLAVMENVSQWLDYCRRESETPDLWRALEVARAMVAAEYAHLPNDPLRDDDVRQIRLQLEQLKLQVRELPALKPAQVRAIEDKLDFLVRDAERKPPRIDWWNQAIAALVALAIAAIVDPEVVRELLSLMAAGLAHLFGHPPSQIDPGLPPAIPQG